MDNFYSLFFIGSIIYIPTSFGILFSTLKPLPNLAIPVPNWFAEDALTEEDDKKFDFPFKNWTKITNFGELISVVLTLPTSLFCSIICFFIFLLMFMVLGTVRLYNQTFKWKLPWVIK